MNYLSKNSIIIIFLDRKIICIGECGKYISNRLFVINLSKNFLMDTICHKKITDMIFLTDENPSENLSETHFLIDFMNFFDGIVHP